MTRLQAAVDEAMPRIKEISNFLCWNDCQKAERVIDASFYEGGPVCIVPMMKDGRTGHTAIKATYIERPYWVAE